MNLMPRNLKISLNINRYRNKKSLSGIYLPSLENDKKNSVGYMGHDEFTIIENSFARRFPVYSEGDANCNIN